MVSTPEGFTDDSPIYPTAPKSVKKLSARKSLCIFTNILHVKKTATCRVGGATSKRNEIKYGTTPCELKQKRKGN